MVDSVGGKPFSVGDRSVGRVERASPTRAAEAPARAEAEAPADGPSSLRQVSRELAGSPPVDVDHVARIRRAIAEGRFPISPATIADHLLALKLEWTGNDKA